jgi:deoxyribodipyrimidine photo-lyase
MPAGSVRVRVVNDRPPRAEGSHVLYWMIGARRSSWNFALDRAVAWARELRHPLVVLEALNCNYQWASDRLHRFVLDGMLDNARAFAAMGVTYHPYVEPEPRAGRGLLASLSSHASVVVTDEAPVFFLPSIVRAASSQVDARFEAVDSCGILPVHAPPAGQVFSSAYAFRRYLQRELPVHLEDVPRESPLDGEALPRLTALPRNILERWPAADLGLLSGERDLRDLPIDHSVAPVSRRGGASAARSRLTEFLSTNLDRYGEGRNQPDDEVSSCLSPYLHFGHLSSHEIVQRALSRSGWTPASLSDSARGLRQGWWGAPASTETFLDQVVTWRELGFNMSARRPDVAAYDALPSWAIGTLDRHASDRRAHVYSIEEFARADTHDPVWNAAQTQLTREGRIHNYLRMLWGKKILEWTASPREALEVMIALNDRYAVDGRDPNSYSGIMWVLGRYDRPWAPERPIFGTVRYMTSANTVRKLRMKEYLRTYAGNAAGRLFP